MMNANWYRITKLVKALLSLGVSAIPGLCLEYIDMKSATFQFQHGESEQVQQYRERDTSKDFGGNGMFLFHVAED